VHAGAGTGIVRVSDNGVGIDAPDLDRIFDRFYRTDKGRSRREGGTGLGLSIVKELVESLGGTVGAESAPGMGTTFTIVVPAAAPTPPVRSRAAPQADPALTFEPRQS
jgi:signal transduction histidine kinase